MSVLASIDSVATEGGNDSTIPEQERSSMRVGQGEPEMMTVSRFDERASELCRWRTGGCREPLIHF